MANPKKRRPPQADHRLMRLSMLLLAAIVIVAGIFYFTGTTPDSLDQTLAGLENLLSPSATPRATSFGEEPTFTPTPTANPQTTKSDINAVLPQAGKLTVAVLDVGQGDSIFLQSPSGKTMLIDAGDSSAANDIAEYLNLAGVTKIDVLVATHPHADHIGSMRSIVKNYDIGTIYMPKVSHTSATYKKLLEAISDKGKKIKTARGGKDKEIPFDDGVTVRILAPISKEYDEMNNYSVVLRVDYGNSSFLLTGDAEKLSEEEMLQAYPELLKADVLKVGHHGSSTSTSADFLAAVAPEYAAISCGQDNSYEHPNPNTVAALVNAGIPCYRTDLFGTIAFFTDGKTIEAVTEKQ